METTVYQSNISIFHKSLDLLISSIINNNDNFVIAAFLCSILGRVDIFSKDLLPGTRRDGEAEPQSLVSVLNIPGLNPKSHCSAYDMKAYVLLIAIRPLGVDVKPGGPFVNFVKRG